MEVMIDNLQAHLANLHTTLLLVPLPNPGGGGGTPYNNLYGEAPLERGAFFRLQAYKRVGISQVEVNKRVGKSVIYVFKSLKGPLIIIFRIAPCYGCNSLLFIVHSTKLLNFDWSRAVQLIPQSLVPINHELYSRSCDFLY